MDGEKLLAGVVLLLSLVPFAVNLVSSIFCTCPRVMSHLRRQLNAVTAEVMFDGELCIAVPVMSRGVILRCVVLKLYMLRH